MEEPVSLNLAVTYTLSDENANLDTVSLSSVSHPRKLLNLRKAVMESLVYSY